MMGSDAEFKSDLGEVEVLGERASGSRNSGGIVGLSCSWAVSTFVSSREHFVRFK